MDAKDERTQRTIFPDERLSCRMSESKTKIILLSSINDDQQKVFSSLNSSEVKETLLDSNSNVKTGRKRKADLTCVVCGGQAIGYNFSQISCESCKAFFRRNALKSLDRLKCLNSTNCSVRSELKQKCSRCRLTKCFDSGMRKDLILTDEEKETKRQRLEENRRMRSSIENKTIFPPFRLNQSDWSSINDVRQAFQTASQTSPTASSVLSLELAPDRMSAFMNTIDLQNFTAVKLINFLRELDEFTQLDEGDRLTLVKYNLTLLFLIHHSLTFDQTRELCYENRSSEGISPSEEAFAVHCKSLFILCYGYEFNQTAVSLLHSLVDLVDRDSIVVQLLMLVMIFSKGLAADDDQEPVLKDSQRVFKAQSKYLDLLFRYLLEKSSFDRTIIKMTRITELLLKIQKVSRDFQQYVKSKVDLTYINPLMKSLLHLT